VDEKTLRSLHRDCTLKLRRFIEQAGKMCDLFARMGEFPLSQALRASTAIAGRQAALAAFQEITA
jgi:hypothetical protein